MVTYRSSRAAALYKLLRQTAEHGEASSQPSSTSRPKLTELTLNISEACNIACSYCFANEGLFGNPTRSFMDEETLQFALTQARNAYSEIQTIKLFGGEPMMNHQLISLAASLVDDLWAESPTKPRLGLVTNLTFLPRPILELVSSGKLAITVSLDGTYQTHDLTRLARNGRGTFRLTQKSLEKLREIGYSPAVEITYSVEHFESNLAPIDLHRQVERLLPGSLIILNPATGLSDQNEFYSALRDLAFKYTSSLVTEPSPAGISAIKSLLNTITSRPSSEGYCAIGKNTLSIASDGSVWPCYRTMEFAETQLLSSPERQRLESIPLNPVNFSKENNSECQSCSIRQICRSCVSGYSGGALIPEFESCGWTIGLYEGILDTINSDFLQEIHS